MNEGSADMDKKMTKTAMSRMFNFPMLLQTTIDRLDERAFTQ
jgi:hypothetical protein